MLRKVIKSSARNSIRRHTDPVWKRPEKRVSADRAAELDAASVTVRTRQSPISHSLRSAVFSATVLRDLQWRR